MRIINQNERRRDKIEKFRPEPSSSSFEQPRNRRNIASGCPTFVPQAVIYDESAGMH